MALYSAIGGQAQALAAEDGGAAEASGVEASGIEAGVAEADPWRLPRRLGAPALCCAALALALWRTGRPGLTQRGDDAKVVALADEPVSIFHSAVEGIVEQVARQGGDDSGLEVHSRVPTGDLQWQVPKGNLSEKIRAQREAFLQKVRDDAGAANITAHDGQGVKGNLTETLRAQREDFLQKVREDAGAANITVHDGQGVKGNLTGRVESITAHDGQGVRGKITEMGESITAHDEQIARDKITERVDSITAHGWTRRAGRVCYRQHGSGLFPDGSDGESDGTIVDLDECLINCMRNEFCHGVVVQSDKMRGTCSLRAEMIEAECRDSQGFDTWLRGPVSDRVAQIKRLSGWTLYERKNCYPGAGSWRFPSQAPAPFRSKSVPVPLTECLLRCEENAMCEGVVVAHGALNTPCNLRMWVQPAHCAGGDVYDTWRMDAGRTLPPSIGPVSGPLGRDRLWATVEMAIGSSFENLDLTRCALIGASGDMKGSGKGAEIDGHTAVIRVNRVPTEEYRADFGSRTDFVYVNHEIAGDGGGGMLPLMGGENARLNPCRATAGCPTAGIIARGDLVKCDPDRMAEQWGPTHPVMGCTHRNISRMVATGFYPLHGMLATTGLLAFFTFLPVCSELNLYGFGGVSTADGHSEWLGGHNLHEEHMIQDHIIAREWDKLPWRNKFREFDWIRLHAARTRKVVGTAA